MKEVSRKLKLVTLKVSPSAISSPESAAGPPTLQLAGISHRTPLWTGSPPCQPFSAAGKQLGQFDPRHLAPVFLDLISQCRPSRLFGEQVAPAIGKSWMCDLQAHLEREGYAVGFAVLPACGVGAPHKRERLFFGAQQLGNTDSERHHRQHALLQRAGPENMSEITGSSKNGGVADAECFGRKMAIQHHASSRAKGSIRQTGIVGVCSAGCATNPPHSFWAGADWLGCRDGKFRPVEPGTFPLANGVPARVGRLRGYGNAIVPQVAAEFVTAFMEAAGATFEV